MGFKLADFFVDLKVNGDTMTLKTMVNSMADMKLETLGEIGALSVLALTLKDVAQQAMTVSTGYTAINKEYGTNITLLQRWQNVARASNVPVDAVAQTFTRMQQLLASPFIGNPNSSFMRAAGLLGIQGANRMNADQLNEVLRVAVPRYVARFTPTQGAQNALTNAGSLAEQLGATRSMMQLYMLPQAQFQRREGSSPIYTDAEVKNWTALNEQVEILKNSFQVLVQRLEAKDLPFALKMGQAGIDLLSGKEKLSGMDKFELALASTLTGLGLGAAGLGIGATASIAVPAVVLMELAARAAAPRIVTVEQNNKVDIHATGGDAGALAAHSKREFDRTSQHHLTRAAQTLNAQQAW